MRTLYYPGSFDPIGNHHLLLAQFALEYGYYDKVCFIPCYSPPHKTALSLFSMRYHMCELAIKGCDQFVVSDIEHTLFDELERKSYTIETVRELKRRGEEEVDLLMGSDSFAQLPTWHEPEALIAEARFVLAPRLKDQPGPGWAESISFDNPLLRRAKVVKWVQTPVLGFSSTMIRNRIAENKTIRGLVPRRVRKFIANCDIYNQS